MWISYVILLTVVAVQAGKRQRVTKGFFLEGQNAVTRSVFNQDSQIQLSGTGIIRKNGQTSLKIQVEIGPAGGQFPAPGTRPPGGGMRRPGGGWRRPGGGGRRPGAGGMRPGAGGMRPGAGAGRPGVGWGGPGTEEEGPGEEEEGPGAGTEEEGPGPGFGGEFDEEEQTGLMKHNDFRKIHDAPPMKLDREMCDGAKEYAEKLAKMGGGLEHSSKEERNGEGENLSMGCSSERPQAMETAVENWYNEVCEPGYVFENGGFSGGTGHFTQVVWKGSTVLGVGRAETERNGMKCAYIVGRYKPAGNMMGTFAENVLKGSFDAQTYCASVGKRGRKFFDELGRPVIVNSTMSAVDVPIEKTGPAKFPGQQVELLNDKKKSMVGNQKDKQ